MGCDCCNLSHNRTNRRLYGTVGTSFERAAELADWYGRTALVPTEPPRCRKCGNNQRPPLYKRDAAQKPTFVDDKLNGSCPTCAESYEIEARWVPYHRAGDVREPYFGTLLYLVEETAKGYIWAYNRAHAEVLQNYFADGLRKRSGDAAHETMTANLPNWIKLGTNRTLVEKALNKLIKMSG
ncbi:hypothetical protein SPHFLASMR4Y_03109 [Sphingorhabdus sp. SMR4y]|nr:hypothetical protein SPHFLASMR4Y_03109 [Sphingorhabdus sp. SMR4y]